VVYGAVAKSIQHREEAPDLFANDEIAKILLRPRSFITIELTGGDGGMAMKASDYSCIPLCPACHKFGPESYHVLGRGAWEARHAIDAGELVRRLASLWFCERAQRVG
jgi:hypothetical protein